MTGLHFTMANSKYEYVKGYELSDKLLPGCWIVIRLDGRGFTRFSQVHSFQKPNDSRALSLMDNSAKEVLNEFGDVRIAFGESDEYSFVFYKHTKIYGRRSSKLVSLVTSCFTGNYVKHWSKFFPETPLQYAPLFDGRAVLYPTDQSLRDYLSWRQADVHINNQYNTCFWALVHSGKTTTEAQHMLKGTQADFKNELLFSTFGINYSKLPEQYRKGSVVLRRKVAAVVKKEGKPAFTREINEPVVLHCDIIKDGFWQDHSALLQ